MNRPVAEAELLHPETSAALPERQEPIDDFVAAASSDLLASLRLIAGGTEGLAGRVDMADEDVARALRGLRVGVKRTEALVRGLVEYGNVVTNNATPELIDVDALARATLESLRPAIVETRADVALRGLPTVIGFAGPLDQILRNLIANALKFRGEEPPRVDVSCRRRGAWWAFKVSDNGAGIEPADQVRIFEMFARCRRDARRPGSGMGLAIAKRAVAHQGGRIWVTSEPDEGSDFHFTIPVDPSGSG